MTAAFPAGANNAVNPLEFCRNAAVSANFSRAGFCAAGRSGLWPLMPTSAETSGSEFFIKRFVDLAAGGEKVLDIGIQNLRAFWRVPHAVARHPAGLFGSRVFSGNGLDEVCKHGSNFARMTE